MHKYKYAETAVAIRYLFLFQILILPFGCSTAPNAIAPNDDSSQSLPSYKSGTTYVYSDGSWEIVAGISPQLVTWQDHRGNVYRRSPDFTYRSTSWETSTRQGSRQFVPRSDSFVQKNMSLWPLQEGKVSSFTEMVTSSYIGKPEKSYRINWTCEVIGTERVVIMAGEFGTWKIACKRYNKFKNPLKARVRETRTWYYAPDIKHYVLTERQYSSDKASRRVELLAVLPSLGGISDLTKRQMNKAFQIALEGKKRGQTAAWSTANTSWSGQITPTGTFQLADGRYSRRYVQKINYPDGPRTYYGMAVRNSDREWVIPRR